MDSHYHFMINLAGTFIGGPTGDFRTLRVTVKVGEITSRVTVHVNRFRWGSDDSDGRLGVSTFCTSPSFTSPELMTKLTEWMIPAIVTGRMHSKVEVGPITYLPR